MRGLLQFWSQALFELAGAVPVGTSMHAEMQCFVLIVQMQHGLWADRVVCQRLGLPQHASLTVRPCPDPSKA